MRTARTQSRRKITHVVKKWLEENPSVTQVQLATDVRVSQPHLNMVINGKSKPSNELIERLARRTKISVRKIAAASAKSKR